ncbi:integral membrane sensor signal transduction histidine kinase [Calditerrivibrio nitroreducens DSM 19672]|uniref:histidine kinase n=2 Tax=Calditerrivibrio nitroreducens TaxID=477976 RepID=E4TG04_CALNY|nr:integral membrane sensor signal transduction histidine kinase [Calditerrivibrio nitroreducens DSM 19672]
MLRIPITKSFKKRIFFSINIFILLIFITGIFIAYNLNKKILFDQMKNITYINYKTVERQIAEAIIYDDIYSIFSIINGIILNTEIFSNIFILDKNGEYITDAKVNKKIPEQKTDILSMSYNITINNTKTGTIIFEINKKYFTDKLIRSLYLIILMHILAFVVVSVFLYKFIDYLLKPLTDLTNKLESVSDISSIPENVIIHHNDPNEIIKLKETIIQLSKNLLKQIQKNIEQEKEIIIKDKIFSIGMMAAGLAHHLKNPIMTIKLLLTPLKNEINTDDAKKDLEVINSELNRMLKLINEFMLLSKDTKIAFEEVKVSELFNKILNNFSSLKGVNFNFNNTEISFRSNYEKLLMIFENLISNSINAGSDTISINVFKRDNKVVFELTDNGYGIPDDIKDKIFIPFFTTRKSGTGLGLAYVENLVALLDGRIFVDKSYGNGAKFVIEIKDEDKNIDN